MAAEDDGRAAAGLAALRAELALMTAEIETAAAATLARWRPRFRREDFAPAAHNLAAFLALRSGDRLALQRRLRRHGLSTLGRCDPHVLATLHAIRATLDGRDPAAEVMAAMDAAPVRLDREAEAALGPVPAGRAARIMTTLEPALAADPARLRRLIESGADLVRINCAKDGPEAWRAMVQAVRAAASAGGREVRVLMDLAGPKIRTARVHPGARPRLIAGDRLLLRRDASVPAPADGAASCACTLEGALDNVAVGAPVAIDDGKIWAEVEAVTAAGPWLRIRRTRPGGAKLKPDRGINFPGTALDIAPLTPVDRAALPVVAELADVVGYSFVQRATDIDALLDAIPARPDAVPPLALLAKIETELAFRNLPEIVVAAAGRVPFGVMIARGDLGVEVGFARLSEVQEEILWLCEAAHVPVVWATDVLPSLVKRGMTARGEFTDAAMAARAECVMLNRGAFLEEAVATLDDVLRRAERHLDKKTLQLVPLRSWQAALDRPPRP